MSGGKLPEGWVDTPLENIVEILDSMRIPVNNKERQKRIEGKGFNKLYPYYGATGEVGKIDDFIFDEELIALGEDGVSFFDGQKNKAYMLYGKTWVNNHAHVLKAIQGLSHNKFLCYFLNQFDYHDYVNGGTRLKLTQANMRKIPVRFAPFSEQKIIAEKLDTLLAQVDSTKARLEQIPQILKRFRHSILASAVNGNLTEEWRKKNVLNIDNWEKFTLGHIVKKIEAGKNLKCIEIPPHDEQYGIIKISAVTWGEYDEDESKTLPDDSLFVESRRIATGDFLISRANTLELLGNPVIVKKVTKNLMLSDKVLRLVMADNDKPWVNIFLRSYYGRREIEFRSTGNQLSMRNIGQKALLEIPMPKPPAEEQHEIVRRVEQLFAYADTIEKQVNSALTRVNSLTQSILAKAFRGELTAQWRAENPDLISGENSAAALLEKIKAERAASGVKKNSRKKA